MDREEIMDDIEREPAAVPGTRIAEFGARDDLDFGICGRDDDDDFRPPHRGVTLAMAPFAAIEAAVPSVRAPLEAHPVLGGDLSA